MSWILFGFQEKHEVLYFNLNGHLSLWIDMMPSNGEWGIGSAMPIVSAIVENYLGEFVSFSDVIFRIQNIRNDEVAKREAEADLDIGMMGEGP